MQYVAIVMNRAGVRLVAQHTTAKSAVRYVRRAVRGMRRHGFGGRGYVLLVPGGSIYESGFVVRGLVYRFDSSEV